MKFYIFYCAEFSYRRFSISQKNEHPFISANSLIILTKWEQSTFFANFLIFKKMGCLPNHFFFLQIGGYFIYPSPVFIYKATHNFYFPTFLPLKIFFNSILPNSHWLINNYEPETLLDGRNPQESGQSVFSFLKYTFEVKEERHMKNKLPKNIINKMFRKKSQRKIGREVTSGMPILQKWKWGFCSILRFPLNQLIYLSFCICYVKVGIGNLF